MPAEPRSIEEASAMLEAWLAPDVIAEAQVFEAMVTIRREHKDVFGAMRQGWPTKRAKR